MFSGQGKRVVLTAPLTESVDNAGFFIQMALASIPGWMEWVIDQKYPTWRNVPVASDGTAVTAPAGLRVLEAVLGREFGRENVAVCYPDQLDHVIGPETRAVGISTHNPLGTTFAAGVYASIFGSSREPINSVYARRMFDAVRRSPYRSGFRVILGGSGAWQITETGMQDELGIDCVVDGRAEADDSIALFRKALSGEPLVPQVKAVHPRDASRMVVPSARTSFGVIEMTTGCGRRCSFCLPDLNPRISFPKDAILKAVEANVAAGNDQISLATEDMFIWGTDQAGLPFFVPDREGLLDLYRSIVRHPGVKYVTLSHSTIAPALVDPDLIRELSELILDRSPVRLRRVSSHPEGRIVSPLIGIETGSVRIARKIMAGKALPFDVGYWPQIVLAGLEVLNRNNWVPVCTLIVGAPDETDEDSMATLDLLYEAERRGLRCFWVPSIFTPLKQTRMEKAKGVRETVELSKLQWQVIMKSWRNSSEVGLQATWAKAMYGLGSLVLWATRLRRVNGPNFTWPLVQFSKTVPESWLHRTGRVYVGKPIPRMSREALLETVRPDWRDKMREAREGRSAALLRARQ